MPSPSFLDLLQQFEQRAAQNIMGTAGQFAPGNGAAMSWGAAPGGLGFGAQPFPPQGMPQPQGAMNPLMAQMFGQSGDASPESIDPLRDAVPQPTMPEQVATSPTASREMGLSSPQGMDGAAMMAGLPWAIGQKFLPGMTPPAVAPQFPPMPAGAPPAQMPLPLSTSMPPGPNWQVPGMPGPGQMPPGGSPLPQVGYSPTPPPPNSFGLPPMGGQAPGGVGFSPNKALPRGPLPPMGGVAPPPAVGPMPAVPPATIPGSPSLPAMGNYSPPSAMSRMMGGVRGGLGKLGSMVGRASPWITAGSVGYPLGQAIDSATDDWWGMPAQAGEQAAQLLWGNSPESMAGLPPTQYGPGVPQPDLSDAMPAPQGAGQFLPELASGPSGMPTLGALPASSPMPYEPPPMPGAMPRPWGGVDESLPPPMGSDIFRKSAQPPPYDFKAAHSQMLGEELAAGLPLSIMQTPRPPGSGGGASGNPLLDQLSGGMSPMTMAFVGKEMGVDLLGNLMKAQQTQQALAAEQDMLNRRHTSDMAKLASEQKFMGEQGDLNRAAQMAGRENPRLMAWEKSVRERTDAIHASPEGKNMSQSAIREMATRMAGPKPGDDIVVKPTASAGGAAPPASNAPPDLSNVSDNMMTTVMPALKAIKQDDLRGREVANNWNLLSPLSAMEPSQLVAIARETGLAKPKAIQGMLYEAVMRSTGSDIGETFGSVSGKRTQVAQLLRALQDAEPQAYAEAREKFLKQIQPGSKWSPGAIQAAGATMRKHGL